MSRGSAGRQGWLRSSAAGQHHDGHVRVGAGRITAVPLRQFGVLLNDPAPRYWPTKRPQTDQAYADAIAKVRPAIFGEYVPRRPANIGSSSRSERSCTDWADRHRGITKTERPSATRYATSTTRCQRSGPTATTRPRPRTPPSPPSTSSRPPATPGWWRCSASRTARSGYHASRAVPPLLADRRGRGRRRRAHSLCRRQAERAGIIHNLTPGC